MFNPFAERTDADASDVALVDQAMSGDRGALEKLVLRHQAWIYNIAIRMVFHPQDAEEVTQEVLVKVITKLSTFKGESKFRTWPYRIAANHALNMKRRSSTAQGHVDPDRLLFVPEHIEQVRDVAGETVREIDDVVERQHAAIFRDHPFLQPADQINWLRRVLQSGDVRAALHLN